MENEMSENKKELAYLSYEQEENGNLTYWNYTQKTGFPLEQTCR